MYMAIVGVNNELRYASMYEETEALYMYVCIGVFRYALADGCK
jgi:hypothetical protein